VNLRRGLNFDFIVINVRNGLEICNCGELENPWNDADIHLKVLKEETTPASNSFILIF